MSSAEFTHWGAFFSLEPWGYEMENWRMGMIASTVANAAGAKRNGKAWRVEDFVPQRKVEPERGQPVDDMRRVLAAMVGKPNG
jgi:hypothetical protein